jgi:hypothetical protein
MKRTLFIMFVLFAVLTALLLVAQEKETITDKASPLGNINPAQDEVWQWMIGEWEGWTESPMGKSEDWMKFEWDLNNQFLVTQVKSTITEPNSEMLNQIAQAQNQPLEQVKEKITAPYLGKGYATYDYKTGEITGYWFDSYRGIYKVAEKRDGNKITMRMEELNGNIIIERTAEKVSEDKMVGTFKNTLPDGNIIDGKFEATRK